MKFSIIVPVYNVERYIEQCIASLWSQDYPQNAYEIIAVDDCTPDRSCEIINRMMQYVTNLRLIHHRCNLNQGGARNTGLKSAKGDYVFFVDSDDFWVRKDVLSVFESILASSSTPVVRSISWETVSADASFNHEHGISFQEMGFSLAETRVHFLSDKFFYQVWSSCYSRDFLLQHGILFREHIVYEDSDWTVKVFWNTPHITLVDFPFYGYRSNPLSITSKPRLKTFQDNSLSVIALYNFIEDVQPDEEFASGIYRQIKKSVLSYIRISRNYPVIESKRVMQMLPDTLLASIPHHVSVTTSEMARLILLRFCPWLLCLCVKILVKVKRIIDNLCS